MQQEELVIKYCERIIEVLLSEETIESWTIQDQKLSRLISNFNIDDESLPEKVRTKMEVVLYTGCNKYVNDKFRIAKAFDIGNGIECIEQYFLLLENSYISVYERNIPDTFKNIKDIVVERLKTIELTSSSDQALLLHKGDLEGVVAGYKDEISDEIKNTQSKMEEELKGIENRKTDIYKDLITIIGIFTAIILTFSGAFSFSSAMLQSIDSVNFYKLIISASIICIFLLSLFIGLYFFMYNIRYEHPLNRNNGSEEKNVQAKKVIKKHRLLLLVPVFVAYAILAGIIVFVLLRYPSELSQDTSQQKIDCQTYTMTEGDVNSAPKETTSQSEPIK